MLTILCHAHNEMPKAIRLLRSLKCFCLCVIYFMWLFYYFYFFFFNRNDFLDIMSFLHNLVLKSEVEKTAFFEGLAAHLYRLPHSWWPLGFSPLWSVALWWPSLLPWRCSSLIYLRHAEVSVPIVFHIDCFQQSHIQGHAFYYCRYKKVRLFGQPLAMYAR